jgi:hypothetical protein
MLHTVIRLANSAERAARATLIGGRPVNVTTVRVRRKASWRDRAELLETVVWALVAFSLMIGALAGAAVLHVARLGCYP